MGGGAAADFGGQSELAILKLQSAHGTMVQHFMSEQCWTMPALGELNCLVGKCNIIKKHCKIVIVDQPRRYSILLCFGVRIQPADADGR